ncbi:protein THYLAKOID RHODANESE-LIKE, chloroplastic isoform X2 [Aegilops tauschii subsp. strangulata]|uniref:Protein THYLAKOID RHODANESE-LIKE, chloroplastic n=1 Tax=Triticum aestivum TaxID=4565 RepID=A0A3B6H196_WHEAT|nr:protein THYLAKOID RHODANESE-LIKE, chloroplastic isoform X2 [Aegilops tauschii subsp. strangulata]XP_044359164.1 protein THYLAKOID RHODANESE-LIKE, chloroplastic-like [Triticum aestivum]
MAAILSSAAPTTPTPPRARRPRQAPRNRRLPLGGPAAGLFTTLGLNGGSAALAAPLSYEEMLRLSSDTAGGGGDGFSLPDLGLGGLVDFVAQNPLVVAAGLAVVAVPLVVSQVLGGASKPYETVSVKAAYRRLLEEPDAQLVDIRPLKDAREVGSPDISEAKKKAAAVPYDGEDKNGFLKKLALRFKDPENTTLIILDKFDGNSELVAELVTSNGYKGAFAVKDGAEGPRGWQSSDLPWTAPKKGFSLDFGELFGDGSEGLPVTIGLAAATGLGLLAYTEIETVLQFLGSTAVIQLVASKLVYAEDRKKTLQQIDDFFNKKIAPKELVDEIKEIGQALLPSSGEAKSQPAAATAAAPAAATATAAPVAEPAAPAAATATAAPVAEPEAPAVEASTESPPDTATSSRPLSPFANYPDLKPPASPSPPASEGKTEVKATVVAATESPAEANSAPVAEAVEESSPPAKPRPLSPYANYPDLKPPASPSPSPP